MTRRTATGRSVPVLQGSAGPAAPNPKLPQRPIPLQQPMSRLPQPVISMGLGLKLNP
jgi:hypothetical protein